MTVINAKPFLKWVGGKSRLIPQLEDYFPKNFKKKNITEYHEPFLGGGAMFFYIAQKYSKYLEKAYLYDVNPELILTYKVVQNNVLDFIEALEILEAKYYQSSEKEREILFYEIRTEFNKNLSLVDKEKNKDKFLIERASQLLFLNKTCFNGLFRVNSKGEFNAPFGKYKKPNILDKTNLLAVSKVLKIAEIKQGDFSILLKDVKENAFIYYDPPYRPITKTSNFVSYSKFSFNDEDQKKLSDLYKKLHKKKVYQLLSNSDSSSINPEDLFFQNLYDNKDFNFNRISASRMINCDGTKRGKILELVINNYK
ncbi:MAG: Dam family site-specific DNA-(adenine-N6)-methyltransferase [Cyanobacteriota bacterium]